MTDSWTADVNSAADHNFDLAYNASAVASFVPSTLVAQVKDNFWKSERKDELFKTLSQVVVGSEESVNAWKELVDLWIEEAGIYPICQTTDPMFYNKDLVMVFPTNWRTFFDCYWKNPSEH